MRTEHEIIVGHLTFCNHFDLDLYDLIFDNLMIQHEFQISFDQCQDTYTHVLASGAQHSYICMVCAPGQ